jgi:hypothetical protein
MQRWYRSRSRRASHSLIRHFTIRRDFATGQKRNEGQPQEGASLLSAIELLAKPLGERDLHLAKAMRDAHRAP